MVSVNISLKREAYEFLRVLKRKNKSFSDVILEFKKRKGEGDIIKLFGALKDRGIDWDSRKKGMAEFRGSFNKRIDETRKKMERLRNDRAR